MTPRAYDSIPQSEDEAPLPREGKKTCKQCARHARKERVINLMILLNTGLFLIAVAVAVVFVCFLFGIFPSTGKDVLSQNVDINLPDIVYSPARAAEGFQAVMFDAALDTVNPWKGPPSDDLDKSWEKLMHVGPIAVTAEQLQKIGKTSVEIPSRPGQYMAKLAVFHQMHCLDRVRRYVHNDYYHVDDSNSSVSTRDHVDHCIDILRQVIACKADTTLITFRAQGILNVDPDFEATHACANFDWVHDWAKAREVNMSREMEEHPKAFQRAMLDALKAKLNQSRTGET